MNLSYILVLSITFTVLIVSIYVHFIKKDYKKALLLLLISGFCFRLVFAFIDPFLQEWDERFHGLVAKNLMNDPFLPLLRADPIMPYDIEDWSRNHIWVHKQPLFLWQMALSMKIFGVNEIAIRIPSVIMGTISIYFIYDMAKKWLKNTDVAFIAAAFFSISYYQLELTSGRLSLDQNDVAFAFYVTASIWAFVRYLNSIRKSKWAVIIGVFVGCAVLNKWLTGILIYSGWGLYEILSDKAFFSANKWKYILLSVLVSLLIFIPWQIYILHHFPVESNIMYSYNKRHIYEVIEGHSGSIWFHFDQMRTTYGEAFLLFIPLGIFAVFSNKRIDRKLSTSLLTIVLVMYSFFSFFVLTKMPAYTFPVNSVIWIFIASGILFAYKSLVKSYNKRWLTVCTILFAIYTLKPWEVSMARLSDNQRRNAKIENTKIYKSLDQNGELKGRVILNCKSLEDVELMFYQNTNAYHWFPKESTLDSLLNENYKFAAFKSHNNQLLPEYIYQNKDIIIIDQEIK